MGNRAHNGLIKRKETKTMRHILNSALSMVAIAAFGYVMFAFTIPAIDTFERENGFPFGQMCQAYNSCK